jgi:hypothetical protein
VLDLPELSCSLLTSSTMAFDANHTSSYIQLAASSESSLLDFTGFVSLSLAGDNAPHYRLTTPKIYVKIVAPYTFEVNNNTLLAQIVPSTFSPIAQMI